MEAQPRQSLFCSPCCRFALRGRESPGRNEERERLAYNADYENIGLVSYLREVIDDLEAAVVPYKVELEAPEEIQFAADRAILVALIINELVLNAGKHAYPNSPSGSIWVRLVRTKPNLVLISVWDEGAPACPKDLTQRRASGLAHA